MDQSVQPEIYDKARQDWKNDILSRTGYGADTMSFLWGLQYDTI